MANPINISISLNTSLINNQFESFLPLFTINNSLSVLAYQDVYFRHYISDFQNTSVDFTDPYSLSLPFILNNNIIGSSLSSGNFTLYMGENFYPSSPLVISSDTTDSWHDPANGKVSIKVDLNNINIISFLTGSISKKIYLALFLNDNVRGTNSVIANYALNLKNVIALPTYIGGANFSSSSSNNSSTSSSSSLNSSLSSVNSSSSSLSSINSSSSSPSSVNSSSSNSSLLFSSASSSSSNSTSSSNSSSSSTSSSSSSSSSESSSSSSSSSSAIKGIIGFTSTVGDDFVIN